MGRHLEQGARAVGPVDLNLLGGPEEYPELTGPDGEPRAVDPARLRAFDGKRLNPEQPEPWHGGGRIDRPHLVVRWGHHDEFERREVADPHPGWLEHEARPQKGWSQARRKGSDRRSLGLRRLRGRGRGRRGNVDREAGGDEKDGRAGETAHRRTFTAPAWAAKKRTRTRRGSRSVRSHRTSAPAPRRRSSTARRRRAAAARYSARTRGRPVLSTRTRPGRSGSANRSVPTSGRSSSSGLWRTATMTSWRRASAESSPCAGPELRNASSRRSESTNTTLRRWLRERVLARARAAARPVSPELWPAHSTSARITRQVCAGPRAGGISARTTASKASRPTASRARLAAAARIAAV